MKFDKKREMGNMLVEPTTEMQIELLERRIKELEHQLTPPEERGYKHGGKDFPDCCRRSHEEMQEMESIVRWWVYKYEQRSQVFEQIENAPVSLRDKLIMAWLFGMYAGPQKPPDFSEMLRKLMGG